MEIDIKFTHGTTLASKEFAKALASAKMLVKMDARNVVNITAVPESGGNEVAIASAYMSKSPLAKKKYVEVNLFYDELNEVGITSVDSKTPCCHVYVITHDIVWDNESIDNEVQVFADKAEALEEFKKFTQEEKKSVDERRDYVEGEENYIDPKGGNALWEYYEDYEYPSYHSCVRLENKIVL